MLMCRRAKISSLSFATPFSSSLCNSYTMGGPPVRGDDPRALASGLSYVQVGKHGMTIGNQYFCPTLSNN